MEGSLTPQRIFRGHSTAGIWLRVAILNIVVSGLIVWGYTHRQDEAQHRANVQFVYAINRSSCAAYSLVDPTIKANETLLVALNRSIDDPKTSSEMLRINKKRRADVQKQQKGLRSFRSVYGTIPRRFDCTQLPKLPPK